jgi:hypothetical protein
LEVAHLEDGIVELGACVDGDLKQFPDCVERHGTVALEAKFPLGWRNATLSVGEVPGGVSRCGEEDGEAGVVWVCGEELAVTKFHCHGLVGGAVVVGTGALVGDLLDQVAEFLEDIFLVTVEEAKVGWRGCSGWEVSVAVLCGCEDHPFDGVRLAVKSRRWLGWLLGDSCWLHLVFNEGFECCVECVGGGFVSFLWWWSIPAIGAVGGSGLCIILVLVL